jgi:hypothetical protein
MQLTVKLLNAYIVDAEFVSGTFANSPCNGLVLDVIRDVGHENFSIFIHI